MTSKSKKKPKRGSPPVILIVDDEEMVTGSLSSLLALETDYQVQTFQSPGQALGWLKTASIDLVISDFLMPGMNGLEFLAEVKKMYPDVPRILLTGYADKENAIRAINEIGLYQYLEKPWDNSRLKLILRNAIASKNLEELLAEKIKELDKALLHQESLAEKNRLFRQEMELARQVQRSLLPTCFPATGQVRITGRYYPALEVGGDFYDVIALDSNTVGILVADVTGHGVQAALSTTLLKYSFASFAESSSAPTEILRGMNAVLTGSLPQGIYVAALVAAIDIRNGGTTVANAGIPHPILIHRNAAKVEKVLANGLLLGIAKAELFEPGPEFVFNLQDNDLLLIYTDGLSEAENQHGEHFEDREMLETVRRLVPEACDAFLDGFIAASRTFAGTPHAVDDITALAIEFGKQTGEVDGKSA